MHNEVGTCAEILPGQLKHITFTFISQTDVSRSRLNFSVFPFVYC